MTGARTAALLPVKIESRFYAPGVDPARPSEPPTGEPGPWRLRLRVVPDVISVDRHDPQVSEAELLAVAAFWRSLATDPGPDPVAAATAVVSDPGYPDALSRLAGAFGPGRAAWLIRTVRVSRSGDGIDAEPLTGAGSPVQRDGASVVRAFPSEIDIWVRWWGEPEPEVIGTVTVDVATLAAPPSTVPPAWLVDWDAALAVGLAAEVTLPRTPEEIEILGVSGLSVPGAGGGTLADLLAAHAASGALTLTAAGQATTIVDGGAVLPTGTVVSEWFGGEKEPSGLSRRTLAALLGPSSADPIGVRVVGDDADDGVLTRLTFPALWGYGLAGVLGMIDPLEVGPLWRWATRWLRPQGSFATVVVDGTAYGVLPVVDPARLVDQAGGELAPVAPLLRSITEALSAWSAAADGDAGLVGGGVDDAVRVLRRGPVPGGLGNVRLAPADLVAAFAGEDVVAARAAWDASHEATVRVAGASVGAYPGRRYWTRPSGVRPLAVPLVVGSHPDRASAASELDDVLQRFRAEWLFDEVEIGDGHPARFLFVHPEFAASGFYVDRRHPDSLLARLAIRSTALAGAALDLWRQQVGPGLDPGWGDEPAPGLLDGLVRVDGSTHARHHLTALGRVVQAAGGDASWVTHDDRALALAEELRWLATDGLDTVAALAHEVATDPDRDRSVDRAMRALLDAASGRWDVWWDAIGAAHLANVQATEPSEPPVAGVYGWVDGPARGRPGPGPGGLVLAPSPAQASTAAALRDRAVHDGDGRWDLHLDSSVVGSARALLADVADGWHPAEVVGRMIERAAHRHGLAAGVELGAADLVPLRQAFPLRTGQGHFGCCHGLRVLDAGPGAVVLARAPLALALAVEEVGAVVAGAADLLLAESVHGVLAGRPERAAVATETLAGQTVPGRLDAVEPDPTGRSTQTLVLAALPSVTSPPDATGALAAAPGFDAAVRALSTHPTWEIRVDGRSVPLDELGLAPVHTAVLDDTALVVLGRLHLALAPDDGSTGGAPGDPPVVGAHDARALAAALAGRAPDPVELRSPVERPGADGQLPGAASASDAVARSRRDRIERLLVGADALAAAAASAAAAAAVAWGAHLERERDAGGTVGDEPSVASLVEMTVSLAAWGIGPTLELADLFADGTDRRRAAVDVAVGHLRRGAAALTARAAAARAAVAAPGCPPAQSMADLGAGRPLPVGTTVDLDSLSEPLTDAAATPLMSDWLPTVSSVRASLRPVVALAERPGVVVRATDPADPWRTDALSQLPPDDEGVTLLAAPRLTVVIGPEPVGATAEVVVIDTFAERVPDAEQHLGLAVDAATPSAAPPQAIVLVPSPDPDGGVTAADLPAAVLLARSMAHARMAGAPERGAAGLGPLAAACALPQDGDTGCPLGDPFELPSIDVPASLVPWPTHADTDDIVAATTADAGWMVGVQWRLGEHLGEDAASPVGIRTTIATSSIGEPTLATEPAAADVERSGWRADELHHTARWSRSGRELVIERHDAGAVGWWSMVARPAAGDDDVATSTHDAVPTRVRWPGQPRRRYWAVDDRATDPVGHGPDRAHPSSLHLVEVISRLGDDWYTAPLPVVAGTVAHVTESLLTDAAGGVWPLRTDPTWSLHAVTGLDADPATVPAGQAFHRALPVLLDGGAALEGPPFEEVALAVDEDENLLWLAILRRETTPPVTVAEHDIPPVSAAPRLLDDAELTVAWSLGGEPPADRVAYLYGALVAPGWYGHGHDLFVQARIRDPRSGALTEVPSLGLLTSGEAVASAPVDHPHVLRPLAVPASGARVTRRRVLARATDGRPVVWDRTERRPLDVTVDVDLPWDVLERVVPGSTETGTDLADLA